MSATIYCSVYLTAKDLKEAKRISKHILNKRLAACANILKIHSLYWWKGKIEKSPEYAIILKTEKSLTKKLILETKKIHSYTTPCIVVWDIKGGNPEYLKWIENETQ